MIEIKRTDLKTLSEAEKEIYRALILPDEVDYFNFPFSADGSSVVIEARKDGQLVGVVLARNFLDTNHSELKSLFVAESHRRQGIGKKLFDFLQKILADEEKMHFIRFFYDKSTPSGEALSKIIASTGWSEPTLYVIRLHFYVHAFDADWIHHLKPLPSNFHLFPWKKRSVKDIWQVDYLEAQGRFLPSISPKNSEEKIEYAASVGLRCNDTLIGWSILHRVTPDTVRFSSLYIDQFFNKTGYGIRLLIESIRRLKELPIKNAFFEINLNEIDRTWGLFVKKKLLPLAHKIEKVHQAIHTLG
jgi:GNAT superfamily N-acetyltransferase